MKFGYAVKYNGVYYQPNVEIPEVQTAPVDDEATAADEATAEGTKATGKAKAKEK